MNAQQEAVAYWKFCESRGLKPSIRKTIDHLRDYGMKVDNASAGAWLKQFSALAPHPMCRVKHKSNTNQAPLVLEEAQAEHLRAHDNVSLVSKLVEPSDATHPQSPPLFLVEPIDQAATPSKPVKVPKPEPKPKAARAPYVAPPCPDGLLELIPSGEPMALREMAAVFVASFANATGESAAKHIGPYATMLAKAAGKRRTTEEAWDACGMARDIGGGKPLFMGTCNRALDHLTFRRWDEPMPGEDDDSFITGADRVAMGELPPITAADIMPWERPPFHPDYAPQVAHG